jgi:hypothetical protein
MLLICRRQATTRRGPALTLRLFRRELDTAGLNFILFLLLRAQEAVSEDAMRPPMMHSRCFWGRVVTCSTPTAAREEGEPGFRWASQAARCISNT